MGTWDCQPPEVAIQQPEDFPGLRKRYDIYALCMSLAQLFLQGRAPDSFWRRLETVPQDDDLQARTLFLEEVHRLCRQQSMHHPVFQPLLELILCGIDHDPRKRWASARDLLAALQAL